MKVWHIGVLLALAGVFLTLASFGRYVESSYMTGVVVGYSVNKLWVYLTLLGVIVAVGGYQL